MNILRDAATLQAQLRLYEGLEATRLTILKIRASLRQNWVALAVAYGLNDNWVACQKLLEEFLTIAKASLVQSLALVCLLNPLGNTEARF